MKQAPFNKELIDFLLTVKKSLSEQTELGVAPEQASIKPQIQKKPTKVIFDKNSQPFEVIFSERGFLIEDTRMSFEELETAISKKYNITLNYGNGLVLDAVKMQKILKYKDLY
ncbi:MAG TPA: hypothetical protein VMZ91_14480 [Candidatus Paceibacterota bacterium]|nr:hypothetical protein [Candidatus Paceibacterota bacterium]